MSEFRRREEERCRLARAVLSSPNRETALERYLSSLGVSLAGSDKACPPPRGCNTLDAAPATYAPMVANIRRRDQDV